ncbi:MAG: LemA family protein [Cyanobacteria bacterium P01_F01_bin.3]
MDSSQSIPEELVPAVLEKASRIYQASTNETYSLEQLMAAGSEVFIPPEMIQQAYAELQQEQHQREIAASQRRKIIQVGSAIALGCTLLAALWTGITYNSLNAAQGVVEGKWAQVENQMQRRADLIPQLTNVAESYADQEAAIIEALNEAREGFLSAETVAGRSAANEDMESAITTIQTFAASNQQLQLSELFVNLQYEIAGTENRIATERMRYNQAIEEYNRSVKSFPTVIVANLLGFEPQPL